MFIARYGLGLYIKRLGVVLTRVVLVTIKCSFVRMQLELFSYLCVRRTESGSEVNVKWVRHKMEIRFAIVRVRNSLRCVSSGLFQNTVVFILI